jgi:hypothetical protein
MISISASSGLRKLYQMAQKENKLCHSSQQYSQQSASTQVKLDEHKWTCLSASTVKQSHY